MGFKRLSQEYYTRWVSGDDDDPTSDDLLFALQLMRHAGYELVVFYDRAEPFAPSEWLEFARDEGKLFFLLYRSDGVPLAAVWLSGPSQTFRQAFAHFCTFDTGEYGEYACGGRMLLSFAGRNFGFLQAVGITPVCYRHALKLSRDLGFVKTALLRQAVRVRGKDRDAVLSINNLHELGQEV